MFVESFSDHESSGNDRDRSSIFPTWFPQAQTTAGLAEKKKVVWLWICFTFGLANQMAKGVGWVQFHCLSFLLAWTCWVCLGKVCCLPAPLFSICVYPCCLVCTSLRAELGYSDRVPAKHRARKGWLLFTHEVFQHYPVKSTGDFTWYQSCYRHLWFPHKEEEEG